MSFVAVFHPYPGFITCWIMALALPVAAPIHQAVGGGSVNRIHLLSSTHRTQALHLSTLFAWTRHRRKTLPVRVSTGDGNEMISTIWRKGRSLVMNDKRQKSRMRWWLVVKLQTYFAILRASSLICLYSFGAVVYRFEMLWRTIQIPIKQTLRTDLRPVFGLWLTSCKP